MGRQLSFSRDFWLMLAYKFFLDEDVDKGYSN
jgi:hypothetical protein